MNPNDFAQTSLPSSSVAGRWQAAAPKLLALLRIVAALLFIEVGCVKMFGFPASMPAGFEFHVFSLIGLAGILEVFGGLAMLLGIWTRPVAFVLAGEMAFAYFMGHFSTGGFWPTVNGGLGAIMFCFVWLYFSAAGAGVGSLDAKRGH